MCKKRYINDNIREDNFIIDLSPKEKLLFVYLLTNSKLSICGIYEIHIRFIELETGLEKKDIEQAFLKFEKEEKIYYRNGTVCIVNFIKNQSMNDNMKKGVEREITELGSEKIGVFCDLKGFERLSKAFKSLGILNFTLLNLTKPNITGVEDEEVGVDSGKETNGSNDPGHIFNSLDDIDQDYLKNFCGYHYNTSQAQKTIVDKYKGGPKTYLDRQAQEYIKLQKEFKNINQILEATVNDPFRSPQIRSLIKFTKKNKDGYRFIDLMVDKIK